MQKQNMNWFATILRVVICFIILMDLTEFSVEVLCGWSVDDREGLNVRRRKRGKSSSLGVPEAPQVNIQGDSSVWAWGCWGGIPSFFNKYRYVFEFVSFMHYVQVLEHLLQLGFIFLLWTMLVWDSPWLIYRMLIALHLNLLSVAL